MADEEIRLVIEDEEEIPEIPTQPSEWFTFLYRKRDKMIYKYITVEEKIAAQQKVGGIGGSTKHILDREAIYLWREIYGDVKRREMFMADFEIYKTKLIALAEKSMAKWKKKEEEDREKDRDSESEYCKNCGYPGHLTQDCVY